MQGRVDQDERYLERAGEKIMEDSENYTGNCTLS